MSIWEQDWTVNDGPDGTFQGSNRKTKFRLEKQNVEGGSFYLAKFEKGEMAPEWGDSWFTTRGSAPFTLGVDPLEPFDASNETIKRKYQTAITTALEKTTTSTRRLEGEMDCGLGRTMAYFFAAREAIQVHVEGIGIVIKDLIVIKTMSKLPWTRADQDDPFIAMIGDPIEDGTGHGNPR
jgi:hypothetical protein